MDKIQVTVDMRLNNTVYTCRVCNKQKNNATDRCQVCSEIKDIAVSDKGAQVMVGTFLVCPDCFKTSDLKLEEPSKIVRTGFVPPKDLQIRPN